MTTPNGSLPRAGGDGTERPIFIFSSGWRTGSTLLQRLLCSLPGVLIWGENRGVIAHFEEAARIIDGLQTLGRRHAGEFSQKGSRAWIAMMNPPAEDFRRGIRRLLHAYYGEPALRQGRPRWGFKEVRHGRATARFLADLYPEARFLLLVRHPEDCLASARATSTFGLGKGLLDEVGGPERFLRAWAEVAADFREDWGDIRRLSLRYEDLVAEPEDTLASVARFLGVRAEAFDLETLGVRRRGWLELPPRLAHEDEHHLRSEWLWPVAARWGYAPRRVPTQGRSGGPG